MEDTFIHLFYKYQDEQTKAWHLFLCSYRWFGIRVDWLVAMYFSCTIIASFLTASPGNNKVITLKDHI